MVNTTELNMFAGILATEIHTAGKEQKAFSLCLPFAFQTSVLCKGLENWTMAISQTDGCGRRHLVYCKGVMFGDEDQDGN